jgi:diguanylate cyclase (GGDEF)-like protein
LNNIGNTCLIMGDAERALGYFRRSVKEARTLAERSGQDRIVEGTALANVGRALTTLDRPDEALPYLRESIDLFAAVNMEALRIHGLVKLAGALEKGADYDEAEELYEEALASAGRLEGETWTYEIHGSLASLLVARNRHDEAEPHLRQAIDGVPAGTTVSDTPYWRRQYSELLQRRGETVGALEEMRRAFRELEETSKQRAETQLYRAMGRLELQRVEHEKELYRLKSEELEELAARDALTGLFNRRWFTSRLSTEIERARRYGHALSVIMLDVDHFKSVNDSLGHPAGDQVLVGIADLLTQNTRGSDEVARYGGEEFAVIMPETALPEATLVCEKLRRVVAQSAWGRNDDFGPVTVSIGVSEMEEGDTPGELLDRADSRLYLAKQRGRDRVVSAE